ncbi:MAG TPA: hypothetical protein PLV93_09920 [Microthrixaceae bacterium]|nr:hypothetical protein [Microthrixaceae bacterium]HNI35706.1 hypothetical protein [Microthrixaceae bacterium]
MSAPDVLTFDCPRCVATVTEAYYGPCDSCRSLLRSNYAGLAQEDLVAEAYEPKMNVTPNAVALKE